MRTPEVARCPSVSFPLGAFASDSRRRTSGIIKRIQILVTPKDQFGRRALDLVLSRSVDCQQFKIFTELLVRRVRPKALTKRGRRYAASTQIVVTRNGQVGIGDMELPAGEPHVPQVAPFSSLRKGTELRPHELAGLEGRYLGFA